RPLVEGPFQRAGGVGRSVDADRNSRHLLPPSNRAATVSSPELTCYVCPSVPAGPRTFGVCSGAFHPDPPPGGGPGNAGPFRPPAVIIGCPWCARADTRNRDAGPQRHRHAARIARAVYP